MEEELALPKEIKLTNEQLGNGKFADVFKGVNVSGEEVALKIRKTSCGGEYHVSNEVSILKLISNDEGAKNFIPEIFFASDDCISMELLGPSLEDLLEKCNRKFSLKTVLMLAEQMISILEYIHSKNVVHMDLSPSNFLIGRGKKAKKLFLIDFGLAQEFINNNGEHIDFSEGYRLRGTYMFSSLFNHLSMEYSRRDDMVSLGYILLYLLTGTLPWETLIDKNLDDKYLHLDVSAMKNDFRRNLQFCKDYPKSFITYIIYNQELLFQEKPDYDYCKKIFGELFVEMGYQKDFNYEWEL